LAVIWIFVAALGRGATLSTLVEYLRERARTVYDESTASSAESVSDEDSTAARPSGGRLRSLAGLHFLRAALALAAGAGIVGAFLIAGFASSRTDPHPAAVLLLSFLLVLLVWMFWSSLSWFLSVASIFVIRQGDDTLAAFSAAVDLCRDRFGPIMAVGTWFGLAHFVLFVVATSVVTFPLAFARVVPPWFVLSAVLLLTLAYFAIADSLYVGRLAAYIAILESPPIPALVVATPGLIEPPVTTAPVIMRLEPEAAMVDQDETILSDVAAPAPTDH
jgi:hypothetical protein